MSNNLYHKNLKNVRIGLTPLLVISVLFYFLFSFLLNKFVPIPKDNILYASLSMSVGIFFVLLDLSDRFSNKSIKKNSIKTYGEIVKCEKHIERNNKGVIEASYYIIDYLINYNGEKIIAQRLAEHKRKVGKIDTIYFNPNNKIIFLTKEVDGKEDGMILYIFAGIFFLIALPIIVFPLLGGILADGNFWFYLFAVIVSVGTIIAGIMLLKKVLIDRKKEKEYEKIEATIIGNSEGSYYDNDQNKMIQTFYPIYEYYYNGIKKTYKCPHNGFLEVGSKQIIMINKLDGDIHTKRKKSGDIFGGIFCIVIGMIALISIIMSLIIK